MITYMMWLGSLCYSCNVRQYPMIYIVVICLILHNTCKYPFSRQLLLPNIISSVYVCGHWAGYLILIWARRRMPARTHRPRQTTAGLLLPILEWQDVSTMKLWTMLCPAATTNCVGCHGPRIASLSSLRCCSIWPKQTYGTVSRIISPY